MPLEATLICIDNSEWTRNGDFIPTRFESQTDAANVIWNAKTNQHPESSVGLLTMAGDRSGSFNCVLTCLVSWIYVYYRVFGFLQS